MRSKNELAVDGRDLSRWEWEGGRARSSDDSGKKDDPPGAAGAAPTGARALAPGLAAILVATDLSSGGDLAVARALQLPCAPRAKLSLLHVVNEKTDSASVEEEATLLAKRLEEARVRVGAHGDTTSSLDISPSTVRGKAAAEIVRAARERGAEVIVVGRHGKSPMRNLVLGSTAKGVIRRAGVPVLVVSQPVAGPYRRPLVAVDFSPASRTVVAAALRFTARETARIDVVHAHGPRGVDLPLDLGSTAYEQEARAHLDEFLRPLAEAGVAWNTFIERGDPRDVIVDVAATLGCDLIVLGAAGRSNVDGVLFSSVAQAVVEIARCDVLVVRSAEDGR